MSSNLTIRIQSIETASLDSMKEEYNIGTKIYYRSYSKLKEELAFKCECKLFKFKKRFSTKLFSN